MMPPATRLILVWLLVFGAGGLSPQAQRGQTGSESGAGRTPFRVRTTAILFHPETFAGQPVDVIDAAVHRVLGPSLITISEPHYPHYRQPSPPGVKEELLVMLPARARVPKGANVNIIGTVRTVLGLRASGDPRWPADVDPEVLKHFARAPVVVADSVQSLDGVDLTGGM